MISLKIGEKRFDIECLYEKRGMYWAEHNIEFKTKDTIKHGFFIREAKKFVMRMKFNGKWLMCSPRFIISTNGKKIERLNQVYT